MSSRYAVRSLLLPALVAASPLPAQRAPTLPAAMRARIDALFKEHDKPNAPGCSLGVMQNGQLAYARGYGMADLERNVRNTPATLFDVGSTSKQFAAASTILLALDGKLSLSDDVRKYIPELPDYGAPITIDHLLRHTNGLRDYNGLLALAGHSVEDVTTDSQALALVTQQRHLNFPTGSKWEYTNTGFFLLTVIIQRVSGKSLADFAHERIFVPLGMTHTVIRNQAAMLIPNRALGYAPAEKGGFKNSMSNWEETGDGAVQLSIDDALKWDENFYHPRVGGAALVEKLQQRGTLANGDSIGYARGLFVDRYRGLRRVHHGGDWIGYHAAFTRFPERHTSVVLFCNSDGISPTGIADKIADIVLASVFTESGVTTASAPRAVAKPAAALPPLERAERFVGSYFDASSNSVLRIEQSGGALALRYSGTLLPLSPITATSFAVTGFPASVTFTLDGGGTASAMKLDVGGAGSEAKRFTPSVLDATRLRGYAGSYWSPELSVTWKLNVVNGKLVLDSGARSFVPISGPLDPAMDDAFVGGAVFLHFSRDGSGRITGFDVSASRMRDIRFDAKAP